MHNNACSSSSKSGISRAALDASVSMHLATCCRYVPRKINSHYRKTITLINCFNAHGTREIEVRPSEAAGNVQ